jgi:hypothetical protein
MSCYACYEQNMHLGSAITAELTHILKSGASSCAPALPRSLLRNLVRAGGLLLLVLAPPPLLMLLPPPLLPLPPRVVVLLLLCMGPETHTCHQALTASAILLE